MPRALSEDTNFVLWWLWYLPWASAADIARATYLTEGAVSNILNRRRKQGWLLSARLGRVFDAVDRFVFSNTGVQEVQTKWGWQVFWWHSPASLRRLARRLEVVEMAYFYLPGLWPSNLVSEDTCWVYEDRPGISDHTGEPVMRAALVERNWRDGFLYDFYWLKDGPFEAIAIYDNVEHDDGLFFLPVLWRGNFQQSRDIASVQWQMRDAMIEDERWSKLPQAQALSPEHQPGMVIFCQDQGSAAVVQRHWMESRSREIPDNARHHRRPGTGCPVHVCADQLVADLSYASLWKWKTIGKYRWHGRRADQGVLRSCQWQEEVAHQANSEVVQRLLGQVGLLHIQPQGVVPQQVELQLLQGFLVGEVEHLFKDVDSQDGLHCSIGAPVVGAVHRSESLLVNEGQRLFPEDLGPTPLQALSLLRRHQELGLPEALLLVSHSEHVPSLAQVQLTSWSPAGH